MESIARVQSVKNSNAIEGIVTTDARIKEIVDGNSAPLNHNEMEIAGYRDVLDEIHTRHMEQLMFAYVDAKTNPNINQLLLIPCVILDFLCIHPFDDGNGRVSRLLSLLLLYKNDYDICKYVSFEEQINQSKEHYYQALYESSQNWHENENSYIPFMENFLLTLYKCYKELNQRFSVINGKRLKKTSV